MKRNKLFLGAALAVLGVSLASCGAKETRNTVTPYGSLKLDDIVATAGENAEYKMSLEQFYDRLRFNGYGKVSSAIDNKLYSEEFNAIKNLYNAATPKDITPEDKEVLKILDKDGKPLYDITDEKIKELQADLKEEVNTVVATKIFSTAKPEEIKAKEKNQKEYNKSIKAFIDSQAKLGVLLTEDDVKNYSVKNEDDDFITFADSTLKKLDAAVDAVILEQAKLLSSMKKLYPIAGDEFITEKDDKGNDKEIKNPNNILKDTTYESTYDSSYKTYGTYNAIVLQFNSKRDADELLQKNPIDANNPLESYIKLYEEHYNYRVTSDLDKNSPDFIFNVDEDNNDFDKLPSQVATFVKDTLKDNEYLTEPRNINNKYVLVYKLDTKYEYHGEKENEQLSYKDFNDVIKGNTISTNLTKDEANKIKQEMTESIIKSNAQSYQSKDYKDMITSEDLNLKIYDPLFEYKFEYANPEFYKHISADDAKGNTDLIFSMGEKGSDGKYPIEYTVDDFFKEASKEYATPIITEYFQLEYANQFYNTYVEKHLISKTAEADNKKALDEAIKGFNSNKNSTYPSEIGLETFLLASYGYKDKDDVIKYYYNAKASLNTYISVKVFDEWATGEGDDAKISDTATAPGSILDNILNTGNALLAEDKLFNINIDHFLINIDENADGTPDDPEKFLAELEKSGGNREDFENAVKELAQAIIHEASYEKYSQNTLYETLKFIKSQYEEGGKLLNPIDPTKTTWDDYKEYNFLITVEQLASSGDINQDSVNNFVPEFKTYVEDVYKEATSTKLELDKDNEKGKFFVVNSKTHTDGKVMNEENALELTFDNLCATSFGYHVLVVNSYEGPESTKYTENDDISGFQNNIQVVLRKHEANKDDKDDKDELVYVYTNSYNTNDKAASINQLFIYYVQQANGIDSVLDSNIKKIMGSLFDAAISTYTSTNFQTWLILDKLNIQITDNGIEAGISSNAAKAEMDSIKNVINSYDEANSPYAKWFTEYKWDRPAI